jgi:rhamnogalacturonyl hydrolase YesR
MNIFQKKNKIRLVAGVSFAALVLSACGNKINSEHGEKLVDKSDTEWLAKIDVNNALDYSIDDVAISVDLSQLGLTDNAEGKAYRFYRNNNEIPHQFIDSDGDGASDQALLLLNLTAAESVNIGMQAASSEKAQGEESTVVKRTHAEIGIKTGGSWKDSHYEGGVFQDVESITLPEQYTDHSEFIRYEGPGIESETVGYRVYLDWRNGFDIFGKKEYGLQLSNIGLDGYQSYHEPSPSGMDILKVGKAVGVGGFGYWNNGAIERVSNVKQWSANVVEDGDLYSAFAIDYEGWNTGSEVVDLRAQLSMLAGSSVARVDIKTNPVITELAVGIVKHKDTELLQGDLDVTGEAWSYVATLGPQAIDGQPLLMYVLFKREIFKQLAEDEVNHALLLKVRGGELHYQFGAYWAGEPGSDLSEEAVTALLQREVERRTFSPRLSISNAKSLAKKQQMGGIASALKWSKNASKAEIKRHSNELAYGEFDTMREREANWEYTMGMVTQSVYQVGKATDDKALMAWSRSIVDSYLDDKGNIATYDMSKYNIDSVNSGKMLLALYQDTGEEKYKIAASHLREQLRGHPRLDLGAFWHKKKYDYQLWLDGVYMGMPFLAEYTVMFENGAALHEVIEEFRVARDHLRDANTGLYFHALDEKRVQNWADPETGLSHYFWSRGMGWLAMAIVDTLDFIPLDHPEERAELAAMAQDLADNLLKYQDENGVWHQITDMAGKVGNYPEASSSSMFTYFLLKGVSKGILPESYRPAAKKSYDALIEQFVLVDFNGDVILTQNCQVGGLGFGRDGSYEYYMSEPIVDHDPKGLAPFIMLGPIVAAGFTE